MSRATTIEIHDLHPPADEIRSLVVDGLTRRPKMLPCRLLYDERGSRLFEEICELDEYYLTRTELAIMRDSVDEMAAKLGPRCAVIEFGSGAGVKSRILLEALEDPAAFMPIDISREILTASCEQLAAEMPRLRILPVCADYMQPIDLPELPVAPARLAVFFPGSTIGNFHLPEAERFLRQCAKLVGAGGAMLIGVDLKKDRATLEAAYDDAQGVTAEFNLNMLHRINRELDADFDVERFEHLAIWNEPASRMEIYAVSTCAQTVQIDDVSVPFEAGERIRTECSYKYERSVFAALAGRAGFHVDHLWTDPDELFSVQYLVAR